MNIDKEYLTFLKRMEVKLIFTNPVHKLHLNGYIFNPN